MNLLTGKVANWLKNCTKSRRMKDYIFYKLVDFNEQNGAYSIHCINTKAVVTATLDEIIRDMDILYSLHPAQACFIGLEYSQKMQNVDMSLLHNQRLTHKLKKYAGNRYGRYRLLYQVRQTDVCICDTATQEELIMDPRDIALSPELISQFDAIQAFSIGLYAGQRIEKPSEVNMKKEMATHNQPPMFLIK